MAPTVTTDRVYVSTACQHGKHEQCRLRCKFCGADCGCMDLTCDHYLIDRTPESLLHWETPDDQD